MKSQPWIELTVDLFIDPVVVEAVEVKKLKKPKSDMCWYIRIHTSTRYYDSLCMEQVRVRERKKEIMEQLVPE